MNLVAEKIQGNNALLFINKESRLYAQCFALLDGFDDVISNIFRSYLKYG